MYKVYYTFFAIVMTLHMTVNLKDDRYVVWMAQHSDMLCVIE